ncbi:hypothetical protein [Bordetella sp. FB-8]|uniref:hypothetical protein n=1 Tax=Bordetella sp. FB-8 TaxID=1159870 RepID=UPI0003644CEB|nr:hypothetical protein [Bordetella sp. FB-8]
MKKISISGAVACVMLLGLASAHAAGMGQDDMKKSGMYAKSDAMLHKAMRKAGKNDGMMQKSGAMHKGMQSSSMDKGTMQK